MRNALATVAVFGGLLAISVAVDAPLESMADPADVAFIPHPEWYFSWLFQLMKLGSGAIQEFGAPMVLNVVIAFLVLLPFLDRTGHRHPRRRAWVMAAVAVGVTGITTLSVVALRETPPGRDPHVWSPVAIAGKQISERKVCRDCHGVVAPDLARGHVSHDNAWIKNHLSDPEVMAPGIRPIPFDAPTKAEVLSVIAYQRMIRAGALQVSHSEDELRFALLYATACASCHRMDGDGIEDGPDLTHAGKNRDARWIAEKTMNPTVDDPKARMPSFKDQMSQEDVDFLAEVLARRK
jgi:cbb3-type cytochrome oxidase cytochrome c subunit